MKKKPILRKHFDWHVHADKYLPCSGIEPAIYEYNKTISWVYQVNKFNVNKHFLPVKYGPYFATRNQSSDCLWRFSIENILQSQTESTFPLHRSLRRSAALTVAICAFPKSARCWSTLHLTVRARGEPEEPLHLSRGLFNRRRLPQEWLVSVFLLPFVKLIWVHLALLF